MTLADIGERAGYSRGLATHHFGSKGAIVQRIMDTVTTDFHDELAQHRTTESAREGLRTIVLDYVGGLAEISPLIRARIALWADAAASGTPDDRRSAASADHRFRAEILYCLDQGLESGEIAGVDREGFTTVLVGMLRGIALQYFLDADLDLAGCQAEALAFVDLRLAARP